jgi:hypothetical protein
MRRGCTGRGMEETDGNAAERGMQQVELWHGVTDIRIVMYG